MPIDEATRAKFAGVEIDRSHVSAAVMALNVALDEDDNDHLVYDVMVGMASCYKSLSPNGRRMLRSVLLSIESKMVTAEMGELLQ